MTGRLTPVLWNTLVGRLRELGFDGPYRGGKHHFLTRDEFRLTIPNSHAQGVGIPVLKEILTRAGVSPGQGACELSARVTNH